MFIFWNIATFFLFTRGR